jgi:hypothetical protein
MSYLVYGSQLPDDEVNLAHIDVRLVQSRRGKRKEQLVTWYLVGQIFDTGATLVSAINARRTLFGFDYQTASFYAGATGSTILAHQLDNASSISGVHVIRASFPSSEPAELATQRTYGITLQATYPNPETELLDYREQLTFISTTDPEVIWTFAGPVSSGIPSLQTMIQSGYALTYSVYFSPPGPLYPSFEDRRQRVVVPISGQQRGQGATDFGIAWKYVHYAFTDMSTYPTTR